MVKPNKTRHIQCLAGAPAHSITFATKLLLVLFLLLLFAWRPQWPSLAYPWFLWNWLEAVSSKVKQICSRTRVPKLGFISELCGVYFVLSLIYPIFKGFLEKYFIHIRTFFKGAHWKVYLLPTQIFNFSDPSGTVVTRAWYLYEIWWIHAHLI